MDHLEEISIEDLQRALDEVEGKRPTQRLLAAITYKHGVTQTELAEWYDVDRKTIYNWLTRLDAESLEDAVTDAHRSGRKRKLSGDQQQEFAETVRESPRDSGYDEPAWTAQLVRHHLVEIYDVEYSIPSCRRLMKEAGLSYQKPRRHAAEADHDDRERFDDEFKKSDRRWMLP